MTHGWESGSVFESLDYRLKPQSSESRYAKAHRLLTDPYTEFMKTQERRNIGSHDAALFAASSRSLPALFPCLSFNPVNFPSLDCTCPTPTHYFISLFKFNIAGTNPLLSTPPRPSVCPFAGRIPGISSRTTSICPRLILCSA